MRQEQPHLKAPIPKNVTLKYNHEGLTLTYRWFSYKYIFSAIFCVIWNGLIFSFFSEMLSSFDLSKDGSLKIYDLIPILFPLPFVAVGIFLAYSTLAGFLNRTIINVKRGHLSIRDTPLPFLRNQTILTSDISQLYCEEIVRGGRDSKSISYQLNAISKNNRKVKILSGLEKDVAIFIEQEIEEWLGIKDQKVTGEIQK